MKHKYFFLAVVVAIIVSVIVFVRMYRPNIKVSVDYNTRKVKATMRAFFKTWTVEHTFDPSGLGDQKVQLGRIWFGVGDFEQGNTTILAISNTPEFTTHFIRKEIDWTARKVSLA